MLNQLDIQQRIRAERNEIQREGQALGILKEAAINNNQQLPPDYAIQLLRLIGQIVAHDMAYRNQYGVDQARMRRSTLGNLAITARLFRDYNNLIPNNILPNYKSRVPGYDGTNIFDDLAYLCAFDIVVNLNPFGGPLYQLSDQEVARILNEVCPVLQEIAASEEAYFQQVGNCPLNRNINMQSQVGINLRATRNMYNNHMAVPQLFISTSYSKETIHIFNAIRAINTCVDMHFGPPLNHATQMTNKRALLRCLTIVGEAFTQANLTPATRAFGVLSQAEFQLFKDIRDKLEHSEFDISLNNVERFIINNDIRPFVYELRLLRALLNLKLRELAGRHNDNSLGIHYFQNNLNNNTLNRFPQIQLFFNNHLGLLNDNLLNQHRQQFPNHFTPQAMAGRIRQEITAINLSLAHAPVDVIRALSNVRPENAALFVEFLQGHPSFRLSIEYHMCRIVKFLGEIPIGQQAQLLAPMQEAEIRVFRNIIAHDLNEVMITGLPLEAFIYQYLAIILQRFPLHQGHQQMPPAPGVI